MSGSYRSTEVFRSKRYRLLVKLVLLVTLPLVSLVISVQAQSTGETTRVSVASDGSQSNGPSLSASISGDGRYVVFVSYSKNLVSDDTNLWSDVFTHDRQTGKTMRISVASDGTQGNGSSEHPSISGDGRYVAFYSEASNLVVSDTNGNRDIFVHDHQIDTTECVSVASDGTQGNGSSEHPSISGDGRYVAFYSRATNLVVNDTNRTTDVFVHDRQSGQTTRISVASDGTQANGGSYDPSISTDGRYVVFRSSVGDLVSGDTNGVGDVFVHDRQSGQTTRISVASDGTQGNNFSYAGVISGNGRYVVFDSDASNLIINDTNGNQDIFVHDRETGETTRVSIASDGSQGNGESYYPSISGDGRYVAFYSEASNLIVNDTNGSEDIFVHDRETGETTRVSIASDGSQSNGRSRLPTLSADGSIVAFQSNADNLVSGDTNTASDVFVHNLGIETTFYKVSGTITDETGNPVAGAAIASSSGSTTITFDDGGYTVTGLITGTYTLTPEKDGCTFSPTSRSVSVPPDRSDQNFTATCIEETSQVTGQVTDENGNALAGVTISADDGSAATTTRTGHYTLTELLTGTYTLTPAKDGYTFDPASLMIRVPPDAYGQKFTAIEQEPTTPRPDDGSWTVLLYLAGDNNLSIYIEEIRAQLEASLSNPDATIVALVDNAENGDTQRFEIQPDGDYTNDVNRWDMGELNMGDPQTLQDFITWSQETYPANYYYLAITDHGQGAVGIAWDDTNADYLTPAELGHALTTATNDGQQKIDVLHYDACLMGLLEHAYEVKDSADFLVFYQNQGWGVFAYHEYIQSNQTLQDVPTVDTLTTIATNTTATTTPRVLAQHIADTYANHTDLIAGRYPRTVSAIDLSNIDRVAQAVTTLAEALQVSLPYEQNAIRNTRSAVQMFASRGDTTGSDNDYADLADLAQRLEQNVTDPEVKAAAQAVMDAIQAAVIAEAHYSAAPPPHYGSSYWDLEHAHGLSIYFPYRSGSRNYRQYIGHELFRFTGTSQWDEFLKDYFGLLGLAPEPDVELVPSPLGMQTPAGIADTDIYLPLVMNVPLGTSCHACRERGIE